MSKIFKLYNGKLTMLSTEVTEIVVVINESTISLTAPDCKSPEDLSKLSIVAENCRVSITSDFDHEIYKILEITKVTHYVDMVKKVVDLFIGKEKSKVNELLKVLKKTRALKVLEVSESEGIRDILMKVDRAINEGRKIVFNADNSVGVKRAAKFCRDASCHVRIIDGKLVPEDGTNKYIYAMEKAEVEGLSINQISVELLLENNRYSKDLAKGYVRLLDNGLDFDKLVTLNRQLCDLLLEFVGGKEDKVKEAMLKMALNIVVPEHNSDLKKAGELINRCLTRFHC